MSRPIDSCAGRIASRGFTPKWRRSEGGRCVLAFIQSRRQLSGKPTGAGETPALVCGSAVRLFEKLSSLGFHRRAPNAVEFLLIQQLVTVRQLGGFLPRQRGKRNEETRSGQCRYRERQ